MSIADLNNEINEIININDDLIKKINNVEKHVEHEKKMNRKYNLAILLFFVLTIIFFPFIIVLPLLLFMIIKQSTKSKKELMKITNNIKAPKYISDLNNELESNKNKIKEIRVLIEQKLNEITLKTYVAGTSFRQKEIKKLVSYLKQSYIIEENSLYDMTKREMIDLYFVEEMIWQFDLTKIPLVLVPEPDNEHDKDAVAVYYEDNDFAIKIGYVPKNDLKKIMKMDINEVYGQLKGGKYKILEQDLDDYDFDKETFNLVIGEYNYSLDLFIQEKEH